MIYKDQYKRQKTGGGLFCRESVGEKDIPDRHRCKQRGSYRWNIGRLLWIQSDLGNRWSPGFKLCNRKSEKKRWSTGPLGRNCNCKHFVHNNQKIDYVENKPDVISFEGGFVESQYNNSILQYTAKLPEFDHQGVSTDRMVETKGSLMIESFPTSRRLLVPELSHLRGHWAENDIKALYSLEIFKENPSGFNPRKSWREPSLPKPLCWPRAKFRKIRCLLSQEPRKRLPIPKKR